MKAYSQDLRKRILETVQRGDGTLHRSPAGSWSASPSSLGCCNCTVVPARWNPGPMAVGTRPYSGRRTWSNSGSWSDNSPMPHSKSSSAAGFVQPHDHLGASAQAGAAAQEEDPRAQEQDRPEVQEQRREFCEELAGLDPRRLVFIDECGANTAMTRTYGRARVGQASTREPLADGSRSR